MEHNTLYYILFIGHAYGPEMQITALTEPVTVPILSLIDPSRILRHYF
jgi:hypothetical protein